jgi:hypothetical protein
MNIKQRQNNKVKAVCVYQKLGDKSIWSNQKNEWKLIFNITLKLEQTKITQECKKKIMKINPFMWMKIDNRIKDGEE